MSHQIRQLGRLNFNPGASEPEVEITFWDRISFVSRAKYKRLQADFSRSLNEANQIIRDLAEERDRYRSDLEQAAMTPKVKADTEAAYQRGVADGLRKLARWLLDHPIPEATAKAEKLVDEARRLSEPLPDVE